MISRACLFSIYDKDIANMADMLIRCPPLMSRSVLLVTCYWLLAEGTDRGTSVSVAGWLNLCL